MCVRLNDPGFRTLASMRISFCSLLLVVALSSCAKQASVNPVALGPSSSVPQKNATLVAGRSGVYVALKPKGTLTLEIQSNTAAGYHWKLARPLAAGVLQLVSSGGSDLPPIALPPETVSTPQAEKWVFKAVGPGTEKVRLIYSRPDRPLDETVAYEFTVNAE